MPETEKFLKDLAKWVTSEDWDDDPYKYGELICRKLVKLGYMSLNGDVYSPKEWRSNATDKQRLISFIEKTIPDDFVCARFSLSFKDDNTAILTMDNSNSDMT